MGTVGSWLPWLPGHPLLVDPAPICRGQVTHQLEVLHHHRGLGPTVVIPSLTRCKPHSAPVCLGGLHC